MAGKPLEVIVGRGTPVHIHVTRDPLTRAQSLEQTLVSEQRARSAQRAGHELADITGRQAQIKVKTRMEGKEPFHPAPCLSQRAPGAVAGGLRAGVPTATDTTADGRRRVHYDASDESHGSTFDKQLHHYRSQVDQMSETVNGLRESLEHERGSRALQEQQELLGRYRRELASNSLQQRQERDDDSGAARATLVQQLGEVETTNKLLRKLLADMDTGSAPTASGKRDEFLKKIGEIEATNRRLREQLRGRDQEVENLAGKIEHTERLQQSFEELKASMKKSKARLEGELQVARQQVCDRDEEINRLLVKHSSANTAVAQLKGVVDTLKTNAVRETAALKGINKELKHQLRQAEAAITELKSRAASSAAAAQQAVESAQLRPCERCPALTAQLASYEHDVQMARTELVALAEQVESTNTLANTKQAQAHAQAAELAELRRKVVDLDAAATETATLRATLGEQRAAVARSEQAAQNTIRALEADLQNAIAVRDALDQHLKENQRKAKAKEFDLREKLDLADQSKRSLQNYVGYVKDTYTSLLDSGAAAGADD